MSKNKNKVSERVTIAVNVEDLKTLFTASDNLGGDHETVDIFVEKVTALLNAIDILAAKYRNNVL